MHWPPLQFLIFGVVVASLPYYESGNGCHADCDEGGWCTDVCSGAQQSEPEPEYHTSWNVPHPEPEPQYNYGQIVPMPEPEPEVEPEPPIIWLPPQPPQAPMCDLENAPCLSGGVCKPQCALNEDMVGRCPGIMCSCCVPKPTCVALGTQCSDSGVCRTDCEAHEVLVGSCMGIGCKCCTGGHKACEDEGHPCVGHSYDLKNLEHSGTCRPECHDEEEDLGHCKGEHCKCCYKKAKTRKITSHSKQWA